jgi:hypothetical protein
MSTTATATQTTTASTTTAARPRTRVSWRVGLATGVVAAAATTALAAAIRAAGLELGVDSEPIPLAAFAQMVLLGAIIGIVIARHARRTTFLRAAVVLTAASCIPSLVLGTTVGDKLGLVLTHVVAAAIVVPRLAPRD